ncbi:MAG: CPBP family intramembrane glutamic endopeptidase, partial [Pirellulaceae bacterium]
VPGMWVMLFVSTAIIVPMVEEFMFRVMLQGGLQRLADPRLSSVDNEQRESVVTKEARREIHQSDNWVGDAYQPPSTAASDEESSDSSDVWRPQAYWPIVVTSLFFALMHLGQGAAPIPLFFLSLGLGFLYRQTGRIAAPLIVHMILNGLTLAVEFSRISAGIEPGGF